MATTLMGPEVKPHHIGPECHRCLAPIPTDAAWRELKDGQGRGLCWTEGAQCDDNRTAEIARLRARVVALEAEIAQAQEACAALVGRLAGIGRLIRDQTR